MRKERRLGLEGNKGKIKGIKKESVRGTNFPTTSSLY